MLSKLSVFANPLTVTSLTFEVILPPYVISCAFAVISNALLLITTFMLPSTVVQFAALTWYLTVYVPAFVYLITASPKFPSPTAYLIVTAVPFGVLASTVDQCSAPSYVTVVSFSTTLIVPFETVISILVSAALQLLLAALLAVIIALPTFSLLINPV